MKDRMIIAGMHRCGTSFFASWVKAMGLYIGENLIGATPSNTKGHFEDLAIVEFHERLLQSNDTNMYESSFRIMQYSREQLDEARGLIADRDARADEWGWKQPRATLFLDMWRATGASFHYVFLIRDPRDVVNSLLRREAHKFLYKHEGETGERLREEYLDNLDVHAINYIRMYKRHLGDVINFIRRYPEEYYLVADFHAFPGCGLKYFSYLTEHWGFSLDYIDPAEILNHDMKIGQEEFLWDSSTAFDSALEQYSFLKKQTL